MDPISVAAALAAPYIAKGADAFSKTAGEKIGGIVGELCQAVANKFKGNSLAEQTLAYAKEKPESEERQGALKFVLADKMKEDHDFADRVQKLVNEAQKEHAKTGFDLHDHIVHGNETNIGMTNSPVLSGTFSGPVNIGGSGSDKIQ